MNNVLNSINENMNIMGKNFFIKILYCYYNIDCFAFIKRIEKADIVKDEFNNSTIIDIDNKF